MPLIDSRKTRRPSDEHILAEVRFPARAGSLPEARRFAERWGRHVGMSESRLYDLCLAVSEASANVLEHSDSQTDLMVTVADGVSISCPEQGGVSVRLSVDL